MPPLRIGVNALYLIPGAVGGTEIYLRHLLAALAEIDSFDEYVVFTNRETGPDLVPRQPNFRHAPQSVIARLRPARILWEQTMLPLEVWRWELDVLFNPGFTAPFVSPCPCVTVFHDLQHRRHPEYFRWFDLPFWRICLYASAHRSRLLLAVSQATRSDLLYYYRLAQEKVRVVEHGVDPHFFTLGRERSAHGEPYLLCVSTLHPHKNIERLLRAFARLRNTRPEFRLIVAGLRGFHTRAVEDLIAHLGISDCVRLTGWIPREELYALYGGAAAFVYPSTFEGFGMPVLEAMAAGLPVACSAIEPLASVAADAALLFDPLAEDSIAEALLRLATDAPLRDRLAAAGPRRASLFSWRNSAAQTLEALRAAAGPGRASAPAG